MVSPPRIERSGLDGRGRQVVVGEGLTTPTALTVDVEDDFIFWADTATKRIETATLTGRWRVEDGMWERGGEGMGCVREGGVWGMGWREKERERT